MNQQQQQTLIWPTEKHSPEYGQVHKDAVGMDSFVSPSYNIIPVEGIFSSSKVLRTLF